ncbi:MAG: hypothetical protein JO290_06630 [Sphingomonadaceae bacterium]|nr:hypothetical protein [Sphingomonadaceae bacterium]
MTRLVPLSGDRQRAVLVVRFGRRGRLRAAVEVSSGGLLAVGALVSSILLSSAVIVAAAGRAAERSRGR